MLLLGMSAEGQRNRKGLYHFLRSMVSAAPCPRHVQKLLFTVPRAADAADEA